MIIPGAEPFFFPNGPTGCLLLHGFTGSPFEMRELGEYLAGQGHTVLGPRLPGHASQPEDMARVRWQDWLLAVEDGWNLLHGRCQKVIPIGLSMGGVLSLLFAGTRAAELPVAGIVALATPSALPDDWRLPYVRLFARVLSVLQAEPNYWCDTHAAENHICYPHYPTVAVAELRDLIAVMRSVLPRVQVPVLLAQSHRDDVIPKESMPRIAGELGTSWKETLWVEESGHVVTRDAEHLHVFEAINQFIREVVANSDEA